jgi:hypothetical protein
MFGDTLPGEPAMIRLLIVAAILVASSNDDPKPRKANTNAIIKEHKEKVTVTASTFWPGWEPENLIDGNVRKSWFSAADDFIRKANNEPVIPWVKVTLPRDEKIIRVTIWGNREAPWEKNYSVLAGKLELLDKDGKVLYTKEDEGKGEAKDFDFVLDKPLDGIRTIKFTILGDEGDKSPDRDIALGEIEVE